LAFMQRLAGDTVGAGLTAEQVRNTHEQLCRVQPDNFYLAAMLSQAYAAMGRKDSALKVAERTITLLPRTKDAVSGPTYEENLALIQTIFGENSRAITTLTQLLQTPYNSWVYGSTITSALLRLDPIWDPLRSDPAFQKLCKDKQPEIRAISSPRLNTGDRLQQIRSLANAIDLFNQSVARDPSFFRGYCQLA